MRKIRRLRREGLILTMSILFVGVVGACAESGPFENFFHRLRRAFSEPQHKSVHRTPHKHTDKMASSPNEGSNTESYTAPGANAVPNERNTRTATRVASKKKDDLP